MKVHKLVSLDFDIVNDLKSEGNFSALVNNLLREHINNQVPKTMEELTKLKKRHKIEQDYERKLKELENE